MLQLYRPHKGTRLRLVTPNIRRRHCSGDLAQHITYLFSREAAGRTPPSTEKFGFSDDLLADGTRTYSTNLFAVKRNQEMQRLRSRCALKS